MSSGPQALPPVKCPKCGHRQHDTRACHKCGLNFARAARGERPWEVPPPGLERAYALAAAEWARVEASPDDAEAHARFAEVCRRERASTFAAIRYRHMLADRPDHPLAAAGLEQATREAALIVQALAKGDSADLKRKAEAVRRALIGIAVAMLLVVLAIITHAFMTSRAF